eukprot:scaffold319057_cov15-Tisochrysis_lutea.AAC.1
MGGSPVVSGGNIYLYLDAKGWGFSKWWDAPFICHLLFLGHDKPGNPNMAFSYRHSPEFEQDLFTFVSPSETLPYW